jgi:hypothetical protein
MMYFLLKSLVSLLISHFDGFSIRFYQEKKNERIGSLEAYGIISYIRGRR